MIFARMVAVVAAAVASAFVAMLLLVVPLVFFDALHVQFEVYATARLSLSIVLSFVFVFAGSMFAPRAQRVLAAFWLVIIGLAFLLCAQRWEPSDPILSSIWDDVASVMGGLVAVRIQLWRTRKNSSQPSASPNGGHRVPPVITAVAGGPPSVS